MLSSPPINYNDLNNTFIYLKKKNIFKLVNKMKVNNHNNESKHFHIK